MTEDDLLVRSRTAMLDALDALAAQREAIIVIGAQAVYLRTNASTVALAEATKDSDLAVDPRSLNPSPEISEAMLAAGFILNPAAPQPGAWQTADGIPVDLMVPEDLAGDAPRGTRGARLPPHDKRALRRAVGLEATLVDNSVETVRALDPADTRSYEVRVAGTGALVVAKTHKLTERLDKPGRLNDKDAHDLYRILQSVATDELAATFRALLDDAVSARVTAEAVQSLRTHLVAGADSTFAVMAGRAESGLGDPDTVALSASILANDLIAALG